MAVVGIGASAGGLEVIKVFFQHMPCDSGMAFVLVQHMEPTHASLLAELLQPSTAMTVCVAVDETPVARNRIYVIPPNREMKIVKGALHLTTPTHQHSLWFPIDIFFKSLADDQHEKAIGILLSGMGSDGTEGLRAIQQAGGITLVQDPSTAKYDAMPLHAIEADVASFVLAVDQMPDALQKKTVHLPQIHLSPFKMASLHDIEPILLHIKASYGVNFSSYKKNTLIRRIERRMKQNDIIDYKVYLRLLQESSRETETLFKELLINLTSFFRDKEAFEVLEHKALPELLKNKTADQALRVWVAACSTGEEVYSIAIIIRELIEKLPHTLKVQIYGTDLSKDILTIARAGIYPFSISHDINQSRLARFFIKEANGYRVIKEIREMIVFATQNVIKDPPFTRLDLLSCRNLLIYLEPPLQKQLIATFRYALNPGGVLFLSPSESVGNSHDYFLPIDRRSKCYRAKQSIAITRELLPCLMNWSSLPEGVAFKEKAITHKDINYAELAQRLLLQYYAPASVITDSEGNMLYIYGETGKYLRPAPGQATLNVLEMARDGLETELKTAFQSAVLGILTLNKRLHIKANSHYCTINLSVRPIQGQHYPSGLVLISFQDVTELTHSSNPLTPSLEEYGRTQDLEQEILNLRENYEATLEAHKVSNEALKTTNEELQLINEELQSTNEELETSKEELQSVNEELITVNSELQTKLEQLAIIQNDMKNLLDNTNTGMVFLDEHLKIRRFTREACHLYRLVESDIGRPLADIKSNLLPEGKSEELLSQAQTVLETLRPFDIEVRVCDGKHYLLNIQPYRTLENVIEGVVMNFTDLSQHLAAVTIAPKSIPLHYAESIIDNLPDPLLVLDKQLRVLTANQAFYHTFNVIADDTLGQKVYDLGNGQWRLPSLRYLLEKLLPAHKQVKNFLVDDYFPTIGPLKLQLSAQQITGIPHNPELILLTMAKANNPLKTAEEEKK